MSDDPNADNAEADDWKTALLDVVRDMQPDAFERLSQRHLREAGFVTK